MALSLSLSLSLSRTLPKNKTLDLRASAARGDVGQVLSSRIAADARHWLYAYDFVSFFFNESCVCKFIDGV